MPPCTSQSTKVVFAMYGHFIKTAGCPLNIVHPIQPVYLPLSVLVKILLLLLNMLLIYHHTGKYHFRVLSPLVLNISYKFFNLIKPVL